ncbi:Cholesterol 7-alpha-monooxygenase [Colletotrichum shisoi]|uniref:Cholesterol 7-alpha-monooxygenase n=1 Tax=Colletotrichum shisoi TaxID=2078593 RepID=A0A5Q4BMZ3_9PEZI|nr:Cholesterol 7-alpha-monooxygenase [Colletotrichum shisoi]
MTVTASAPFQFAVDHPLVTILAVLASLCVLVAQHSSQDAPPSLPEALPFIGNTYQYMTDLPTLMDRVSHAMKRSDVVRVWLGPVRVYLVKGGESVQAMFRASSTFSYEKFILMVIKNLQGSSKEDVSKFVNDKSGVSKTPAPGWEDLPPERRCWYQIHHLAVDNLSRANPTARLIGLYARFLGEALEKQPLGEWATVRLFDLLREDMGESALRSLCGTRILEVLPDYIHQFWRFDSIGFQAVYGLPKWINPKPAEERDRLSDMTQKFLREAFATFDWDGPDAESDWEPVLGSRYIRLLLKWLADSDMTMRTMAGFHMISVLGVNANTIPVTAWAMMEVLQDRELLEAVREEALQAMVRDPATGERSLDAAKLASMPLLQSVYVECMRLHVSIAITREVLETTTLRGFRLEKGSLIQAPTNLMHFDEQVWGHEEHPATEFWAGRHVKQQAEGSDEEETGRVTAKRQFVMAGKPSEFFPYGGGVSICPGRFLAKQEIILTVAMLVTRFDMEFVEWTCKDGSKSDRPPVDDEHYFGSAAMPPDRDVRVRWKRLW